MSIDLFKHLVDPLDDLNSVSLDPTDVSLDPYPDELFEQLKSKVIGLDLLGAVDNDLPVLPELRELVFKLGRPEILVAIYYFAL